MIAPHEAQAMKNHSQTLTRLAERGGLSPSEAIFVLSDEQWRGSTFSLPKERHEYEAAIAKYEADLISMVEVWSKEHP